MADFDSFQRYKQKGLDARRAGQWDSARVYLLEAARSMLKLSESAVGDELRQARRATSAKLLELARDCESAKKSNRRAGAPSPHTPEAEPTSTDAPGTSPWLEREKSTLRFDDIAGLESVKADIRLKMIYPFEHPELAERFGVKAGGGVLLYGPPGTGKTMLAKATAGELDAAFFRISPADILSKWVGEAEQNVKKLFDTAASQPRSVIFIDEVEALVPARRDDSSSVMQRVVPQLLQAMEGFDKGSRSPMLFMGATNVPWQLDPAVLRPGRFDDRIYIPLPDEVGRLRLLELNLRNRPVAADVNLPILADRLHGFSGADIKYFCDRAAAVPFMQSIATGKEGEITIADFDQVLGEARPSVDPGSLKRYEQWNT